jgi:putative membrane protein
VNAFLNASSAVLVVLGWRAIRAGERDRHKALMLSALAVSTLFLVGYLTRVALTGTHRFPGTGALRSAYLPLPGSPPGPAAGNRPPLGLGPHFGWKGRFDAHRRVARFALPAWLYVSVTGVMVYFMLYWVAPIVP